MKKDFDKWNKIKKVTDNEPARLYTVREVWWCRLGVNVGFEQDGSGDLFLRPVVIIRGFGKETCLIVPLTASFKEHELRLSIGLIQEKEAKALLSQVRVVDTRRLVEKIGFLDKEIFTKLRKAVKGLL